ncbi:MAG: hypothetical protein JSW38_11655 [Dehalococcoidia bacterium]|nr:MAG: hypothetical protein JSW38_11655 [Dehalococcoidia bacterium]
MTLIVLIVTVICCISCDGEEESQTPAEDCFGIYLTADDVSIDSLAILSYIEPADEPLISSSDINSYSSETHEIELTTSAADRIQQINLSGNAFVVCVDHQPIYSGAFMSAYFSITFDGVVIMWPLVNNNGKTIRIELGYPGEKYFVGEDPRSDPKILECLDQHNKLH